MNLKHRPGNEFDFVFHLSEVSVHGGKNVLVVMVSGVVGVVALLVLWLLYQQRSAFERWKQTHPLDTSGTAAPTDDERKSLLSGTKVGAAARSTSHV